MKAACGDLDKATRDGDAQVSADEMVTNSRHAGSTHVECVPN